MKLQRIDSTRMRSPRAIRVLAIAMLALAINGCTKLMADQTANLMIESAPVVEMEEDPIIAEAATLSGLKTVEGMLFLSPKNEKLLQTVTQSFAGYGAAFIQPDWALRDSGRGSFDCRFEIADFGLEKDELRIAEYGFRMGGSVENLRPLCSSPSDPSSGTGKSVFFPPKSEI